MKRENRYLVLKRKDIDLALTPMQKQVLENLCNLVSAERKRRGADDLYCVVVENDWPEYEPTWTLIEKRVEDEERSKRSFPQEVPIVDDSFNAYKLAEAMLPSRLNIRLFSRDAIKALECMAYHMRDKKWEVRMGWFEEDDGSSFWRLEVVVSHSGLKIEKRAFLICTCLERAWEAFTHNPVILQDFFEKFGY